MFTTTPEYLAYIEGDPLRLRSATARFFSDAAEFAAALIDALLEHEGRGLMPRFTVLNVNHPPRHRSHRSP